MHGSTPEEAREHMAERWRKDRNQDPMAQAISEFRARADHHRRHHQLGAAQAYDEMAELVELALHLCGSKRFGPEQAAMISGLSRERLPNGAPAKGRISVAALPVGIIAGPLHSVRACELLREQKPNRPGRTQS